MGDKTSSSNKRKWGIALAIVVGITLIFAFTHIEIYKHGKQVAHKEWIEKCKKSRDKERRFLASLRKNDFHEALTGSISELQPKLDGALAFRIASEIIAKCKSEDLDPILITALIWVESRFDILAHSNKGAVGLMQVRYTVWKSAPVLKDNGVNSKPKLFWVDLNIKCGTEIFAEYYKASEYDIVKTLYRYNSGSKELPECGKYDIEYANKIIITACEIRESMRKGRRNLNN